MCSEYKLRSGQPLTINIGQQSKYELDDATLKLLCSVAPPSAEQWSAGWSHAKAMLECKRRGGCTAAHILLADGIAALMALDEDDCTNRLQQLIASAGQALATAKYSEMLIERTLQEAIELAYAASTGSMYSFLCQKDGLPCSDSTDYAQANRALGNVDVDRRDGTGLHVLPACTWEETLTDRSIGLEDRLRQAVSKYEMLVVVPFCDKEAGQAAAGYECPAPYGGPDIECLLEIVAEAELADTEGMEVQLTRGHIVARQLPLAQAAEPVDNLHVGEDVRLVVNMLQGVAPDVINACHDTELRDWYDPNRPLAHLPGGVGRIASYSQELDEHLPGATRRLLGVFWDSGSGFGHRGRATYLLTTLVPAVLFMHGACVRTPTVPLLVTTSTTKHNLHAQVRHELANAGVTWQHIDNELALGCIGSSNKRVMVAFSDSVGPALES